jgi:hypothetical protein
MVNPGKLRTRKKLKSRRTNPQLKGRFLLDERPQKLKGKTLAQVASVLISTADLD